MLFISFTISFVLLLSVIKSISFVSYLIRLFFFLTFRLILSSLMDHLIQFLGHYASPQQPLFFCSSVGVKVVMLWSVFWKWRRHYLGTFITLRFRAHSKRFLYSIRVNLTNKPLIGWSTSNLPFSFFVQLYTHRKGGRLGG